jgi:oligopeptide transport system substrate-binding protein
LQLAAILGREFDFATLTRASDLDEDTLIDALDNAERSLLIEEISTDGMETFAFAHALIPVSLIEGIRTLKRRKLHRRAAEAIEILHSEDFEALAHHNLQAGRVEKGVKYLLQAGDRARGLYAHQEAINSYEQAIELLEEGEDHELTSRTLMKLGLTYHNSFEFDKSRRAYEQGFILWQQAGMSSDQLPPAPHALKVAYDEPPTLDPGRCTDQSSVSIIYQIFSGLVELSPDLSVMPDIARNWEVLEGGRKYVFHLRNDVYWSDGVPVTARDFEYAWRRVLEPASHSYSANLLSDILGAKLYYQGKLRKPDDIGVHAVDDLILVAELEEPTSYFLQLLTYVVTFPVPSAGLEKNLLHLYEKESFDFINLGDLHPVEADRARQIHAGEYVSGPILVCDYVGFNVSHPPLDDIRVRRALTLATSRERFASITHRGLEFPATGGLVPPGMPGHSPNIAAPYDPEQARTLMEEAGYPHGQGFQELECLAPDDPSRRTTADYLKSQWLEILGIDITWKFVDWSNYLDLIYLDTQDLWLAGFFLDYPDPDYIFRVENFNYLSRWQNENYDNLVEETRKVMDQEARMKLYQQADRIVVEEAALIPLSYGRFNMLVKPWVKKLNFTAINPPFWKDIIIEQH